MKDILKELREGRTCIGTICNIEHPQVIELIGYAGWDYVLINMEDSTTSPYGGSLDNMVRAAYAADITPMAKLLMPDLGQVYKALNYGIKIIHVSVNSRDELDRLMKATKYPTEGGTRISFPFLRANKYGVTPFQDYWREENKACTIVPLLETNEAMENMEEILSYPGLELATIGPFDLAMHLGGIGEDGVAEKIDGYWAKLENLCVKNGVNFIKPVGSEEQVKEAYDRGCRCIIAGADIPAILETEKAWANGLRGELKKHGIK